MVLYPLRDWTLLCFFLRYVPLLMGLMANGDVPYNAIE